MREALSRQDSHWIAWLAGLLDGEGAMTLNLSAVGRYRVAVDVGLTHEGTVRKAAEMLGQKVRGPFWSNTSRRPYFSVRVLGPRRVRIVLEVIRPWLVAKAEHADLLLAACPRLIAGETDLSDCMTRLGAIQGKGRRRTGRETRATPPARLAGACGERWGVCQRRHRGKPGHICGVESPRARHVHVCAWCGETNVATVGSAHVRRR